MYIITELIGAEGARSSKMHSHFLHKVFTQGAYLTSCGSSGTGETLQTRSVEEAHRPPRGSLSSLELMADIVGEKQYFIRKEPYKKSKSFPFCNEEKREKIGRVTCMLGIRRPAVKIHHDQLNGR